MILDEIKTRYNELCKKWGWENPTFAYNEKPEDFGTEHIEIADDGKISVIVTERGKERNRWETYSIDEVLYRIFRNFSHSSGFQYEFENRDPNIKDPRAIAFPYALEQIAMISEEWRDRLEQEQKEILERSP
jgi:Immunity protein 63